MEAQRKRALLRPVLFVVGVVFVAGIPAMMLWIWPGGWR
jgi:hypothetical protein